MKRCVENGRKQLWRPGELLSGSVLWDSPSGTWMRFDRTPIFSHPGQVVRNHPPPWFWFLVKFFFCLVREFVCFSRKLYLPFFVGKFLTGCVFLYNHKCCLNIELRQKWVSYFCCLYALVTSHHGCHGCFYGRSSEFISELSSNRILLSTSSDIFGCE